MCFCFVFLDVFDPYLHRCIFVIPISHLTSSINRGTSAMEDIKDFHGTVFSEKF